jgi:hypothetical protein
MAKRATDTSPQAGAETVSAYFRRIFKENPKLLKIRSNEEVLQRWLMDHPGHKEVPENVKQGLSNVKSILRSKRRRRGRKPGSTDSPVQEAAPTGSQHRVSARSLEQLEGLIDECLWTARGLDPEGLASVIALLRRARNEVVWKAGQ